MVHAICDALLGAANLRDIGFHFSNTDERWRGISSLVVLKECVGVIGEKGWNIGNIDAMVCLEAPKINPHIPQMKINIAEAAGINDEDISIKATTNETMGFVGRQEGVVAYAVCLIEKIDLSILNFRILYRKIRCTFSTVAGTALFTCKASINHLPKDKTATANSTKTNIDCNIHRAKLINRE